MLLPFVKKDKSDLPIIKLINFNTTTNKSKDFLFYDYYEHLKKISFTWEHKTLGSKYGIRISDSDNKKIKQQLTMKSDTRKKLCLDSIRVWNMSNAWSANKAVNFRYSYLIGYLEETRIMESMIVITGLSFDFKSMSIPEKNGYLRRYSHNNIKINLTLPYKTFFTPLIIQLILFWHIYRTVLLSDTQVK